MDVQALKSTKSFKLKMDKDRDAHIDKLIGRQTGPRKNERPNK